MQDPKETPERRRERLRQEELRRNPSVGVNDAFNRASSGGLADLVGSLGWKGTGILILLVVIISVVLSFVL